MIQSTRDEKVSILFQEWDNANDTPAETAIVITQYSTEIELMQFDNKISINYQHVKELIAHLKKLKA